MWLLVIPWELDAPGGVSQVVGNLARAAKRRLAVPVTVLVKTWDVPLEPDVQSPDGTTVARVRLRSPFAGRWPLLAVTKYLVTLPRTLAHLSRLTGKSEQARIFVHYPDLDSITWILFRRWVRRDARVCLSFHGTDLQAAAACKGFRRRAWVWLLRSADVLTTCSSQLLDELHQMFPEVDSGRCIGNGVDFESVTTLGDKEFPRTLPSQFALCLATYEAKKGQDLLVEAFKLIADRAPSLSLVFAGRRGVGGYFELLKERVDGLALAERVQFMVDVPHPQAMALLSKACVLVVPSRREPFGIVALEASVLGVPVVATKVCGAVKLFDQNCEVHVVESENPSALAQGLMCVLNNIDASRQLAAQLRTRVARDFTWEAIADAYEAAMAASGSKPIGQNLNGGEQ